MTSQLAIWMFPVLAVAAGIGDLLTLRIPNWINLALVAGFAVAAVVAAMPLDVALWHLLVGAVLLAAGFVLFALGYIGGGDAKMLAAAGLWVGTAGLPAFLLWTAIAGGALALCVLLLSVLKADLEIRGAGGALPAFAFKLPYGVAIAAGSVLALPHTWWMVNSATGG